MAAYAIEWNQINFGIAIFDVIVAGLGGYLIFTNRNQPMIKHRSWALSSTLICALALSEFIASVINLFQPFSWDSIRALYSILSICGKPECAVISSQFKFSDNNNRSNNF